MKLRLSYIMEALPRYNNYFTKGPYKNGNYQRVLIHYIDENNCMNLYDANDFPREFLERPYYVKEINPGIRSVYNSNATIGLDIYLGKEENKYV